MRNHYADIDRLISLYLSHQASESEKQELAAWLHASTANREVFSRLERIWSAPLPEKSPADMDLMREQIWATGIALKPQVHRVVDVFYWSKVAATALLFLLGAGLLSSLVKENRGLVPEAVALVQQVNPAGHQSVHMLPDGSKVWLNAESSLTYPEKFSDTLRLIQLKGEAFFEVAKNPQKPFVVEAAGISTQALGTAFNVNAYPEESTTRIALLEGKVQVQERKGHQTAILSPGEELLAAKKHPHFRQQPYNYEKTFGWKEQILLFDGADLASFRRTIEKWYGVQVKVRGMPAADWHIRARYQREDLRHVLRDICFNKNITFEMTDKNVVLTF